MRLVPFLLPVVLVLAAPPAAAQWRDAFDDGDFTARPPWTGTADAWRVAPFGAGRALWTSGAATADTLVLATASPVAHGRWAATVAWRDVNLSNFNGVRLYLVADTDVLDGPVRGYFVQLGATNTDEVRLYRQDGAARNLLGRSPPVLTAETDTLRLVAARTPGGRWTVAVDGDTLVAADDAAYAESRAFGLWVKHTAAAADAYAFTDLSAEPPPAPPDTTAPVLLRADPLGPRRVRVGFSEPAFGCDPGRFSLAPDVGAPTATEGCTPGRPDTSATLVFADLPPYASYTLTARDLADAAGNVRAETQATFFAGILLAPAPGAVVVNEVMPSPPAGVPEYVELFNRSDAWLDLGALRLGDAVSLPAPIAPRRTPFPPGTYAVVSADAAALADAFPDAPAAHEPADWPTLNNAGDAVVLASDGGLVDRVDYDGGADAALERIDPDAPSGAFNWAPSSAPRGGTPGVRNSRYGPDRTPPAVAFAEEIGADVVEVTFSEGLDGRSVAAAAFRLGGTAPASVSAASSDAAVWRLQFDATTLDTAPGAELRVDGVRDPTGNVLHGGSAPLARRPRPGDVVINELLPDPLRDVHDGRPDQPEYVELFNRGSHPVTLRGAFWTGRVDERGAADTLRLPDVRRALPPGGFAVVFAGGDAPDPASALAAAFPGADLAASSVLLLPLARATLALAGAEDVLDLRRADGAPLDRVAYAAAWHRPDLLDARGTALERLAPAAPSGDAASWASAVHPDGGTPGGANSLRLPAAPDAAAPGLTVAPSPFSPDADGHDDLAVLTYRLAASGALLRVRVFDAHGRLVRTLTPAALAARAGRLVWDGFDADGRALPVGVYVAHLEAVDARGGTVEAYAAPVVLARSLR